MIQLPRFTFLCGGFDNGQTALIQALCERDDAAIRIDLHHPIYEAMFCAFPDIFSPLEEVAEWQHKLIHNSSISGSTFFNNLTEAYRKTFGTSALGSLCLAKCVAEDTIQMFERLIFSDCTDREDAMVFIDRFGADECIALHLGDLSLHLGLNNLPCRHIWLAHTSVTDRIRQLENEPWTSPTKPVLSFPSTSIPR